VSAAPRDEAWYTAFFEELRGLGFVEDQNLTVIPGGFGVCAICCCTRRRW
jgi:hypothetical protein